MIIFADPERWKRGVRFLGFLLTLALVGSPTGALASKVTLAWDSSSDPNVTGYNIYYGSVSRTYTNLVNAGTTTSATISNLVPGTTYYFAATTYTLAGLESAYSAEMAYTVPASTNPAPILPPTLDPIADMSISENSGLQTVTLTGITTGSTNVAQFLTVNALSSNPALIPNPTVKYTSPNTTASIAFAPTANSYGAVTMTVMVDDGAVSNNAVIRSFLVTVTQAASSPAPLTNAIIAPNTTFRYLISPPYPNGDRFSYSLGLGAPVGAKISQVHGLPYLSWTPTTAQSLTTNLIPIVITDSTRPSLSTNQTVLVTVLDFLALRLGSVSVPAGQSALLPIYLSSSSGVTNLSFTLAWSATQFTSPSLFVSVPGVAASSLQNQQTNLLISLQMASGQVLQNSNLVAQVSFQTSASEPSAFVGVPVHDISATKPDSSAYVNYVPTAGQVVVVNSKPLLEADSTTETNRTLTAYGAVGTSYQLQYSATPLVPTDWAVLMTYTQTNTAQTLSVDPRNPLVFYRLLAR